MSMSVAKQMKETIIDMETCRKCKEFGFEYVENDVAIPFCKLKWFEDKECPYDAKAEEILKAFGIALGEATAKWAEAVMKEE